MDSDEEEEVATKQLKYAAKWKCGEESQNLEDSTGATNTDKNRTRN